MDCIIKIFDLIIKAFAVFGVVWFFVSYVKVKNVEKKIELFYSKMQEEKNIYELNKLGALEDVFNELEEIEKKYKFKIDALERKRKRILSKIPFLK